MAATPTVLVVEDDPDHLEIMTTALRHHGYEVRVAVDGFSGVEKSISERPDVVLMDASLPGLDGWSATATIKQRAPEVCVLMVTAHALPEHRQMAQAVGCDGFYTKPIEPTRLLRIVQECVERRAAATADPVLSE
jgi:two-component system cell cycle response regulator DivK